MELTYTATPDQMLHVFKTVARNQRGTPLEKHNPLPTRFSFALSSRCVFSTVTCHVDVHSTATPTRSTQTVEGPERGPAAARDREGWRLACV
jgi:hypothetical protein